MGAKVLIFFGVTFGKVHEMRNFCVSLALAYFYQMKEIGMPLHLKAPFKRVQCLGLVLGTPD